MGRREALWRNIASLLDRVVSAAERDRFLDECLDTLVELLQTERAVVLATRGGAPAAIIAARGPGRALTAVEREEISRSILDRALRTGETVVWTPSEGDLTESLAAMAVTAAVAVPLRAVTFGGDDDGARGVLYVDYRDITKVVSPDELEFLQAAGSLVSIVLELGERAVRAREELRLALAAAEGGAPSLEDLLWPPSMAAVRREVMTSLYSDAPMLLLGESGTGKTLLARAIAEASGRKPVIRATLGASDDLNTITSELFGHERGAFSGAIAKRVGLVEPAAGGTLILDEILNLPRGAQQLLLDFTQFGTYRPLGYDRPEPKRVKTRLIAVTNGDLDAAVREGRFREDLYHRLANVVLRLPPLRERAAEIPALVEAFLQQRDPERGWKLSLELRRRLAAPRPWPGNVRRLEAAALRARERALAADAETTVLRPEHFGADELSDGAIADVTQATTPVVDALAERWAAAAAERDRIDDAERDLITAALEKHAWVVARAARELNVPRTSLVSRMQTLGVEPPKREG